MKHIIIESKWEVLLMFGFTIMAVIQSKIQRRLDKKRLYARYK